MIWGYHYFRKHPYRPSFDSIGLVFIIPIVSPPKPPKNVGQMVDQPHLTGPPRWEIGKGPKEHPVQKIDMLILAGGFKYFLFSTPPGEVIQFDQYFSNGLKPPTSNLFSKKTDLSTMNIGVLVFCQAASKLGNNFSHPVEIRVIFFQPCFHYWFGLYLGLFFSTARMIMAGLVNLPPSNVPPSGTRA